MQSRTRAERLLTSTGCTRQSHENTYSVYPSAPVSPVLQSPLMSSPGITRHLVLRGLRPRVSLLLMCINVSGRSRVSVLLSAFALMSPSLALLRCCDDGTCMQAACMRQLVRESEREKRLPIDFSLFFSESFCITRSRVSTGESERLREREKA